MRKWLYGAMTLAGLLLCACQEGAGAPLDSDLYDKDLSETGSSFHLLQLTDIHWSFTTDVRAQTSFLDEVKDEAVTASGGRLDFIMITGDSFLDANKAIANALYDHIESWGIPYAVTFGNHDRQGDWSPSWMSGRVAEGAHSYYVEVNDEVTGRSNYVLNVHKGGQTLWQIYSFDSNSYAPNGAFAYDYDWIHDDQVAWYEAQAAKAKAANGGAYVPSLGFFHIPLSHIFAAAAEGTCHGGKVQEKAPYFYASSHGSSVLPSAIAHGMKGMFWGHDHSNDSVYRYEGMVMGYGVKTGTELYYAKDPTDGYERTGGALYELKDGGRYDLTHFFLETKEPTLIHSWGITGL
jgi:predicted MPP superfamily phosphohydrolase